MTALVPIVGLVVVFIFSTLISQKMTYEKSYWLFEMCHLFAGFFIAMLVSNFIVSATLIILSVLAVGLFWEIWEFIASRYPKLRKFIKQGKITFSDTLLDLSLDVTGAALFIVFF